MLSCKHTARDLSALTLLGGILLTPRFPCHLSRSMVAYIGLCARQIIAGRLPRSPTTSRSFRQSPPETCPRLCTTSSKTLLTSSRLSSLTASLKIPIRYAVPHPPFLLVSLPRGMQHLIPPRATVTCTCSLLGLAFVGRTAPFLTRPLLQTPTRLRITDTTRTSKRHLHNAWILAGYRSRGLEGPYRAP